MLNALNPVLSDPHNLSLQELIRQTIIAERGDEKERFTTLCTVINEYLANLKKNQVPIICQTNDKPHQILIRTMQELERIKETLCSKYPRYMYRFFEIYPMGSNTLEHLIKLNDFITEVVYDTNNCSLEPIAEEEEDFSYLSEEQMQKLAMLVREFNKFKIKSERCDINFVTPVFVSTTSRQFTTTLDSTTEVSGEAAYSKTKISCARG